MNLAWTFEDFCQPKTAPTRLGKVSYHWAMGEQQGGLSQSTTQSFSAVHIMLPPPKRQA
jgi:hypothetical protein